MSPDGWSIQLKAGIYRFQYWRDEYCVLEFYLTQNQVDELFDMFRANFGDQGNGTILQEAN